jgi:hypothetical protein
MPSNIEVLNVFSQIYKLVNFQFSKEGFRSIMAEQVGL